MTRFTKFIVNVIVIVMRKLFVFILIFFVPISFSVIFRSNIQDFVLEWEKRSLPKETRIVLPIGTPLKSAVTSNAQPQTGQVNLAVPFSPQAPFGDWSLPYQEACEEASVILIHKFYKNSTLTPEITKQEILKLVDWQKNRFGHYQHTTAAETAAILHEYYGYKRVDVLYDITIDIIKLHLLAGRPAIVPLAGQLVGNPYYRQPGPVYHMLVIKGITKNGDFITNDVGTKRGQNYVYDDEVLFNAIHDVPEGGNGWLVANPEEYIKSGLKAIVVVYPN